MLGPRVGAARARHLNPTQALVLSFGTGSKRVLAQVSVHKIIDGDKGMISVFINMINPITGNSAPDNIQVGNTVSAEADHLYFPKSQ